ncbi:MAG: hypothetical protein AAF996_04980 [Pseudomonadota bacterium]
MRLAWVCLISCFLAMFACAETIDLKVGQTWTFKNAPHPDTRIVIGKIEQLWDGRETAVSVSVVNLNTDRGLMVGGTISHLPFAAKSIRPYLLALDNPPLETDSEFEDGYQTWKYAIENEGAGVFTISPAEAIDLTMNMVWEGQ